MPVKHPVVSGLIAEAFLSTFTLFIVLETIGMYVFLLHNDSHRYPNPTKIQETRLNALQYVATWAISMLAIMFHAQVRRKTWARALNSWPALRHPTRCFVGVALATAWIAVFAQASYVTLYWTPSKDVRLLGIGDLRITIWLAANFIVWLVACVTFVMRAFDEELERGTQTVLRDARRARRRQQYAELEKIRSYGTMI
ncbi:hypothetical protein TruAng_003947 [Truncatella angustata]|nr:hypothetical protein TruAng_003947 [Truncatella angustata]